MHATNPRVSIFLQAGKRSVNLEFLSPGMQKRAQNTSYHERKRKRLLWHLEWKFVAADLHIHQKCVLCFLRPLTPASISFASLCD